MAKRLILIIAGAVLLVFVMSSLALAFTPQDIYNDYLDNGKLDNKYTKAELEAYLNDATIHQYGDPAVIAGLDLLVREMLRSEFPFTGFQLAIAAIVAVALIGGGFALRRFTRPQKS
jgi:ABC-type antimicrobial peptide transport system permease subunit